MCHRPAASLPSHSRLRMTSPLAASSSSSLVIARGEATKQSRTFAPHGWIASRSLSSGAHSRDPLARNDDRGQAHAFGPAACPARVFPNITLPMRGRREDRASDAPAASYAKVESIRVSHHRFTGSIRPSLRNGFNGLFRALPGEPGLLSPSPRNAFALSRVDASVGASGPHDFAVREISTFVLCAIRVHRIPPNVRDDGQRPSSQARQAKP